MQMYTKIAQYEIFYRKISDVSALKKAHLPQILAIKKNFFCKILFFSYIYAKLIFRNFLRLKNFLLRSI